MTRHDIPPTVRTLLGKAAEESLIDLQDLYVLAIQFGSDFDGLVNEIVSYAFATRHSDSGAKHSRIVSLAEKHWQKTSV